LREKPVVIGVRSDPIPHDRILIANADGPITDADPRRVERRICVDLLEMKARVGRVLSEETIRLPSLSLDMGR
jgi:hypothetical protein